MNVGMLHTVALDAGSQSISIVNRINLATTNVDANANYNYEVAMRVNVPSIKGDSFFTDLNGFQVLFYQSVWFSAPLN